MSLSTQHIDLVYLAPEHLMDAYNGDEIKQVCNWFHAERFINGNPHGKIKSHGICDQCARRWRENKLKEGQ